VKGGVPLREKKRGEKKGKASLVLSSLPRCGKKDVTIRNPEKGIEKGRSSRPRRRGKGKGLLRKKRSCISSDVGGKRRKRELELP